MKTISIGEVTRARLERLTDAQDYATQTCIDTSDGYFFDIAMKIQVFATAYIRCAQNNLKREEETLRRALSALVWLSKTAGVTEVYSSNARRFVSNLHKNEMPVPDAVISAMSALAIFEARAREAAISLQCDIEEQ